MKDRTKELHKYIESLSVEERWEQIEYVQTIRNRERKATWKLKTELGR